MTILVDSSGFCQQQFRRQIEVLKPENEKKATGQKSSVKKSLSFKDISNSVVNTDSDHSKLSTLNRADSPQEAGELFLSYLNMEDLLERSSTEAKVVIVNPGGHVETFSLFHDKTKSIIVNLCRKTLKTVANLTFEHPNIWEELPDPLRRTVSKEFQEYCNNATDSVLKKSRADDLATFLNKVLVHEVDVWCRGVRVLAEKLGRPVSQNRYPIYDQNLRFSLPYL